MHGKIATKYWLVMTWDIMELKLEEQGNATQSSVVQIVFRGRGE